MTKLLSISQAAARSGFSRYMIKTAAANKQLRHYRPSAGTVKIPEDALENWMRSIRRGV